MEKKLSASSRHAKLARENRKNISTLSKPLRKEMKKLLEIPESHIDYSDIP